MAKKNKEGSSGLAKVFYYVMLFLLGLVIWSYWQGSGSGPKKSSYADLSLRFDNALLEILVDSGFRNDQTLSQSRRERREGKTAWLEYYREMQAPASLDLKQLLGRIESAAGRNGLKVLERSDAGGGLTVDVGVKGKVFSRLVVRTTAAAKASPPAAPAPTGKKRLALVIDDVGGSSKAMAPFLELGIPITFAIMPHEPYSKKIAGELTKRNMPYILHLPLEPESYPKADPGKYALFVKMSDGEIRKMFEDDFNSVPGVKGVSNHMGSRFSEDEGKMKVLLSLIKEKGLFYFDSYTTPKTLARKTAKAVGLPELDNGLFVDDKDDPEYMKKEFAYLRKHLSRHGEGIAIGHVQRKNIVAVLREEIPKFKAEGVEFVYLTDMVPGKK